MVCKMGYMYMSAFWIWSVCLSWFKSFIEGWQQTDKQEQDKSSDIEQQPTFGDRK